MAKIEDILTEDLTAIHDLTDIEGIDLEMHHILETLFALLGKNGAVQGKKTEAIRMTWEKVPAEIRERLITFFGSTANTANMILSLLFMSRDIMDKVSSFIEDLKPDPAKVAKMIEELPQELKEALEEKGVKTCSDALSVAGKKISWH